MDEAFIKSVIELFPKSDVTAEYMSATMPAGLPTAAMLTCIEAEVVHITGWAKTLGVSVHVEIDDDGNLFMSDLGRDLDDPSTKGNGAIVIGRLCEVADAYGLVFDTSHMSDEPDLTRYYARFGFAVDGSPGLITNLRRKAPARH